MLRIQLAEIPEEGLQIEVSEVSWFPDEILPRKGDLRALVTLERSGERILARGSVKTEIALCCDRCLESFSSPLALDFQLVLELPASGDDAGGHLVAEHGAEFGEIDVVVLSEPLIDLGDILYQQVILAMPQKILCRDDCRGICGVCGQNLNQGACGCRDEDNTSPFAVLGKLAKKKQ